MTGIRFTRAVAVSVLAAAVGLAATSVATAGPHSKAKPGVRFAHKSSTGGYQALVSDGPGTGYGFHRSPGPYRVGALAHRERQADALHEAVETDALTSGNFRGGFLGDSVYASGPIANRGVFSGADGYGSPYFAGYYGPGDGEDLGPLGTTYND